MKYRGRRWNNILILLVIGFIVILNLPTAIKSYLIPPENEGYPVLFHPGYTVTTVNTENWSLSRENSHWVSNVSFPVSPTELIQRWQKLAGTAVDSKTYQSLASSLQKPETVEIWYEEQEEPQRVTFYRLPKFWLLKNWQDQWIAVSVASDYLFPQYEEKNTEK
ncbi:hypothetical protein VA7868_02600 [Vibrio aerogenes CECT 7868]|uniref:50S ribosomal protein L33 n=1 Tax=Vibrio aerogenes CECT 7868 TaxID=1216006 RepID=A0A1M5ZDT7_9VIBR|nr:hypothetical protein VA7868_02600 [Vibrio aerogenes CECT 7868]